jgi:tRNA threonylcarbamoyladenosine biosynthesis protein TsaB
MTMSLLRGPVLALDTSGPSAHVAVLAPTGERLSGGARRAERHSANLLPLCDQALVQAGVGVADLGGVACGRGPGSFTGLRVGLAVAKGLALPFDLPLVLVSSLAALARDLGHAVPSAVLAPCLDAGKGEIYGQIFRLEHDVPVALSAEQRLLPADYAALVKEVAGLSAAAVGGPGLDRYAEVFAQTLGPVGLQRAVPGPSAESVGALGLARLGRGERDDLETAVPSYGRPPDITMPRSTRRK